MADAALSGPMLHPSRGGDGRPHEGHARPGECYSEVILRLVELEARVGRRLPPKMTPAQIAEAQRMAREWKRLGAPRKSCSECALDERAAPRKGLCSAYGAFWRSL